MGTNQIGSKVRLAVNEGTDVAPDWKRFEKEVTLNFNISADELEARHKDSGEWVDFIKTQLSGEVSFTAQQSLTPGTHYLNHADVFALTLETYSSATKGERQLKIYSDDIGGESIVFQAHFKAVSSTYETNGLVSYNSTIRIKSKPVLTPVVA